MPSNAELCDWKATDWDDLREIWRELTDIDGSPIFRGEEIDKSQAGYVFETWITQAFRLSELEFEPPFRVPREPGGNEQTLAELDGFAILDQNRFIIESKFQQVDFAPIARMHLLAEQRPVGTMGLLFAAGGFTAPAFDSAHILRPIRALLFPQADISLIAQTGDMAAAIRLK